MADSIRQMQFLWPATCFCKSERGEDHRYFKMTNVIYSLPKSTYRNLNLHFANVQILLAVHEQSLQRVLGVVLCTFDEKNDRKATCQSD